MSGRPGAGEGMYQPMCDCRECTLRVIQALMARRGLNELSVDHDPILNVPPPKKSNARRGKGAAKTTEASTSASKGVKQTGASSSTEQRPPCTRLTKEGADKLGKTKCKTLAAALVAECASCVKRKLKGKPLLTKREMWASALRRLMYEKRHVDDETMRKIVAWVGENKADMRRPVWLEASIKESGLKSFAPGYVTRLEACWLAYWYDRFELFKVLYDELVNHAPQYRRADAELLFMMVLTRPNMQAMNKRRNIVFEGALKLEGSPTYLAEKFAQLMKIDPRIKFLDWLRERTHWGRVDSPVATHGDAFLFHLFESMRALHDSIYINKQSYDDLDRDILERWFMFRYLHLHRDRLGLNHPDPRMRTAVMSTAVEISLELNLPESLFVQPLHEDWGLLFFTPAAPAGYPETVYRCIDHLNLDMLKYIVEHGYKEYPDIVRLMKEQLIEAVDNGEMIMEMLENDEENAFTEVEKFIIYFETLDTVANEDKKHINALYEIVEEHKTSLSEGVFIGVMKYLQRQHDKAAENTKDHLLRNEIDGILSERNAMLMADMPFAGLFRPL